MKIFILLALVTLAAADWKPKSREELQRARLECMQSANLSEELKLKANRLEYPDKDEVNEFILCGGRASELWDDKQGWLPDRVIALLEGESNMGKDEMREIIDRCLDNNSQRSPLRDWSARNYKCVIGSPLRESFIKILKKIE